MDEDVSRVISPYKSKFFAVMLSEFILALVIIAAVLILKYFFPKQYKESKKWYEQNVTVDTNTEEIVKGFYDEV